MFKKYALSLGIVLSLTLLSVALRYPEGSQLDWASSYPSLFRSVLAPGFK